MTSVDLGRLNPHCPLIPLDEDEICGDNPDPPEVIDMEMIEWKGKVVTSRIIEWQKQGTWAAIYNNNNNNNHNNATSSSLWWAINDISFSYLSIWP